MRVSWLEFPETYAVNFEEAGVKSTIHYNKDGSFISAIRYYSEEKLPYYLIASLKEKFPGKKTNATMSSRPYVGPHPDADAGAASFLAGP